MTQPQASPSLSTQPTFPVTPVPAPVGPRERRVRLGHLGLAIALVVVGALGDGAQITNEDLVTVRIGRPPGLDPVPASEINRVVGNYAAMPLAAGTLLTASQVTAERHPGPGEVRLGINLRGERLPAQPIRPGNLLLLVDTSTQNTPTGERPTAPRTWNALLVAVGGGGQGGLLSGGSRTVTIDVIVAAQDAPVIAGLAANNNLSVAVLPGQPGR
jgi:hypothetical protein